MLDALEGLVRQLRLVGVPVSVSESIDAVRTLDHVDLRRRPEVKAALRCALVKNADHEQTFDTIFDVYFGLRPGYGTDSLDSLVPRPAGSAEPDDENSGEGRGNGPGGGGGGSLSDLDEGAVRELLLQALRTEDGFMIRMIAGLAVDRHANFEPGRPVAGTYYLYRTMRAMKPDALLAALTVADGADQLEGLDRRLQLERGEAQVQRFRDEVAAEIRRRLVADRGADAVAQTLRTPLPEDVTFLTASQAQITAMRTTIEPLTRKLASKLAQKRRHKRRGALDFRRTVRRSMSTGGVPVEPVFRKPSPSKPQLIVLADISGSVATFAAFTLQLTYALRQEFASVRCFVFVDGVDEVTDIIASSRDIVEATTKINEQGCGVWLDGRSDYGHSLEAFWAGFGQQVTNRSTVVVLGDARTNYHAPREDILGQIRRQSARLFWLNPETPQSWDSGDSVIGKYAPHCDAVYECRNVRQLKAFVEQLE